MDDLSKQVLLTHINEQAADLAKARARVEILSSDRETLWQERNRARRWACRMMAERDEAQAALAQDRADKPRALAAGKKAIAFAERMIAERNEARKELAALIRLEALHRRTEA